MNPAAKRHALLVGATGLVGNELLRKLIGNEHYDAISTLGRRAPDSSPAGVSHHVTDFAGDWTDKAMPAADVLFCCLGTTIKRAGSRAAFRAIDLDLVVTIAGRALDKGTGAFIVVSSVGADPDSPNFYLRTKGEMEQAITGLGFRRLGIVRPSLLLGARNELRPGELLGQYAARLVNPLLAFGLSRYRAVDATTVAAAMIGLDQAAYTGARVIEGSQIKRMA